MSYVVDPRVASVRRFNRFYTRLVGALGDGYLGSALSLTEVRVLYELAHREAVIARDLARELALDPGYLSRILQRFAARGWVEGARAADDGRRRLLRMTDAGRAAFAPLDVGAREQIGALIAPLRETDRRELVGAMAMIERLLGNGTAPPATCLLRPPQPGELGWVVQRHGALYAHEFGYDARFEALVARIVADFVDQHDPPRERCWIAEREGEPVGCVFLVRQSDEVAKLRLFLVEPSMRGLGIGTRLIDELLAFARQVGYRKVVLWTQGELSAARRVYQRAGFVCVSEEPHHSFGKQLVAETWELTL